ncbi:MAG: purine-nucleoside phosphorylase [Gammaproteobacteria bacterium]|nr:purine-nucleoside phosphorylase [Gammaproteobacteria bacterium]
MRLTDNAKQCAEIIKKRAPNFIPKIGMILGSGLGAVSDEIKNAVIIPYSELPGFSITEVEGHGKRLHIGILKGAPVACLEGRTHIYEGSEEAMSSLRTIIRALRLIGCEILLTTNAVGSLRTQYGPGNLMLVKDHINFTFFNPLIGPNDDEFGGRFVSMDNAYDKDLRDIMLGIAKKIGVELPDGVFLADSGPTFESHAEIRAYKMLGADAVGMSTVPETIIARHCGLKVITVCAITNFGAGLSTEVLSHEGTLRGAKLAVENLAKLFLAFAEEIGKRK